VHTSIAGFGKRAGIAPLEEVVTVLELLYDIDTGIDLNKLYRLSQLAEKTFALPVQFHKPIIGDNAFLYEVGDQIEGVPDQPLVYEPFPPEVVGRETQYYFGRQTGKHLIETRLARAEIKASSLQVEEIIKRVRRAHESVDKGEAQMTFYQIKKLLKELRKGLSEEEFWRIVEEVTKQKPRPKQQENVTTA
jgi:D-citramalate synthase